MTGTTGVLPPYTPGAHPAISDLPRASKREAPAVASLDGLLHGLTLHRHDLVVEEWAGSASYYAGEETMPWRYRLQAAVDATIPAERIKGLLDESRSRFEEQADALLCRKGQP